MSLVHLYNNSMDVYTITETQSDTGGVVETETKKSTNIPCLIEKVVGRDAERELLGREGVVITHIVYADVLSTVLAKDRIKIPTGGTAAYDVEDPDDVQGRGHHREIMVVSRN